jgi:hypothetical protein
MKRCDGRPKLFSCSAHFRILHVHRGPCSLSEILFSDAEGRKDQVQDVIAGGLAGERVEMTKGSV